MRRRCVCREGRGWVVRYAASVLFYPPHFFPLQWARSLTPLITSYPPPPTILCAGQPPLQISSGQWKHAFQVSDHLGNTHLLQLVVELHLNITDSDGEYGAYLDAFPSLSFGPSLKLLLLPHNSPEPYPPFPPLPQLHCPPPPFLLFLLFHLAPRPHH